jgi:4-hydroxybutyrate CoA-transferase
MPGWQERYRDKCVSVESALQVLQPQHTVVIGMNGNIPASLCQALGARLSQWPDLHILGAGALHQFPFHQPEVAATYTVHDMFITMATRPGMQQRVIDFLPFTTALWPGDLEAGLRAADVFLTSVSPPNEHGYCSFGPMLWTSLDLVEAAKVVIAEVDEDHIVTYGDVASTMGFASPTAVDRKIVARAAALIGDGDIFQLGAGMVSIAVVEHLQSEERKFKRTFSPRPRKPPPSLARSAARSGEAQ